MLNAYETAYKLSADPFRLNPDHTFAYGHPAYSRAKAYLKYALEKGEGFVVITGGAGTGKTTLINEILAELDTGKVQVASLTTARLVSLDLLHMVAVSFGLHPEKMDKVTLLTGLEKFLIEQNRRGWRCILIVDEAQGLSRSGVEELRLLANLQYNNQLLLQIFLVGQERLAELVRGPRMEHLRQRVIAASHLEPLDPGETVSYVEQRLVRAGWRGDPKIRGEALQLIHTFSGGIPRRINLMCSRLLLYGSLEGKHDLTGKDARDVIEDLRRELLLAPEAADAAEVAEGMAVPINGGPVAVSSLPRAESFKFFRQTVQPARRNEQRKPGDDVVRKAGSGPTLVAAVERYPGESVKDPADTAIRERQGSAKYGGSPDVHVAQGAGKWTGRILAYAALLAVPAVIAMLVMRPDIRERMIATEIDGQEDSVQPPLLQGYGSDVHDRSAGAVVNHQRSAPRESVGMEITSTATREAEQPEIRGTQADVAATALEKESSGHHEGNDATIPEQPDHSAVGGNAVRLQEKMPVNKDTGVGTEQGDETRSVAQTTATEPEAATETERDALTERAAAHPESPSDEVLAKNAVVPQNLSEPSNQSPVSTTGPSTSTRGSGATKEKAVPPPTSRAGAVTEPQVQASVPSTRNIGTGRAPEGPQAHARRDAPILLASAAPPEETERLIRDEDHLKSVLLGGKWKSRENPAVLLPSDITFCKAEQDRINCWSTPQNTNTKYGKAEYKVEGTLQNFSAQGDFLLSYRTLVRLITDSGTSGVDPGAATGAGRWQITEHAMSCSLAQLDRLRCRDEKGVMRDYYRNGPML